MTRPHGERGLALVCALSMLLAASALAVSVGRMSLATLASAEAERDRAVARESAEAALRDAERGLAGGGLPVLAETEPPAWQALDLRAGADPALQAYGAATGARMATGGGVLPARLPVFVVERLAAADTFRVTAAGFGTRTGTTVVLQALLRQPGPVRVGWREIANWPELHARAVAMGHVDEREKR